MSVEPGFVSSTVLTLSLVAPLTDFSKLVMVAGAADDARSFSVGFNWGGSQCCRGVEEIETKGPASEFNVVVLLPAWVRNHHCSGPWNGSLGHRGSLGVEGRRGGEETGTRLIGIAGLVIEDR